MKKLYIKFLLLISISFLQTIQANEYSNIWYLGGKAGLSKYNSTGLCINNFSSYISDHEFIYKKAWSLGTFLGYKINKHFGFELGYDWLGKISYKNYIDYGSFKVHSISLVNKINKFITDDFNIYTRLGGMIWRANFVGSYFNGDDNDFNNYDFGVTPLFAVGLEYNFNDNWATRLDCQKTRNIGNIGDVYVYSDNIKLDVGISYNFGKK